MMDEKDGTVRVELGAAVILHAVELYLNEHLFKDSLKVVSLEKIDYGRCWQVTAQTVLQRLAGETNEV